jgi:hypothetical protein
MTPSRRSQAIWVRLTRGRLWVVFVHDGARIVATMCWAVTVLVGAAVGV